MTCFSCWRRPSDSTSDETAREESKSTGELEITSQDLKFLRSMRIAVNDKR